MAAAWGVGAQGRRRAWSAAAWGREPARGMGALAGASTRGSGGSSGRRGGRPAASHDDGDAPAHGWRRAGSGKEEEEGMRGWIYDLMRSKGYMDRNCGSSTRVM